MDKDSALGTSKLTRFLYVILAIAFVLGLSPIGTSTAYADDSDNSVTVTVNVYDGKDGKFLDMYREVTVTPGIAEEYGYTNDSTYVGDTQVSALDVLVAEHKAYYGDAFTTTSHDQLSVSSSGWIQLMFNTEPAVSGYTYFVNQANPVGTDGSTGLMVNQAVVSNGDYIDFVITPDDYYSELGESYGHMYGMTIDFAYFGDSNGDRVASIGTEPGASVTVNLKRFWALANMMGGTRTVEDFSDVSLAYVDAGTGEIGTDVIATTGEDGTATLTFSDPGTYYVSATGKYESIYQRDQQYYEDVEIPMIEPLIKITVKEPVGSITLTVENTTYTDSSQSMTSGAEPAWTGTLIDQVSVPIYEGDTVYSAAKRGIEAAGFTMESGSYGGIGTVNGLAAGDANGMTTSGGYEYNASGWMELVNDWFINTLPEQVSVSDGDEITVAYSVTGGPDIGGDWSNTDKSLKSIATSTGTLSPEFSSSTYEYTLTVPKGTRSLTVTPTASNKDYQVHTYLGDQATGTEYARSAEIPVDDGSVITVVCGDESWPTMNDNSSEKQTYTITIEEEQRIGSITLTVENTTYTDSSQSMTEGAEPAWTGTLIDQVSVPIYEGDTVLSAAQSGIEAAGFTMESGSYGGIGTVNGLAAGDANGMTTYGDYEYNASGWMELVNDWFINTMPESVSVSDGDEITVAYSVTGGPDLGGDSSNTDKTLKSLTTSAGTLSPEFSSSTYEYTLTVPRGTTSVKVTPTASNKNYQVHTYLGDQATGTEYARSSEIPVEDGSVITVVCGDESWPTMNDNSSEKQTYTITVSFPSPWQRINGTDRYETMSKIVEESFDSCDTAVVASGENFPDALSASALAGQLDCPVVITETSTLSDSAKSTLESLGVSNVVIVGGKAAVSESAESAIEDMGITASRVSGKTRQDTSLAVMDEVLNSSQPDTVIVATGKNFADALSIAPLAYAKGFPVVLTENDGTLTSAEVEAIQETGAENAIIVGGSAAVSSSVDSQLSDMTVTRINGKDRYATSSEIANYEVENCGMDYSKVAIASGENFPDALTGAAMCGYNNSVLILANDTTDSGITEVVNNGSSISTGYVLGGSAAVSEDVFDYLDTNAK